MSGSGRLLDGMVGGSPVRLFLRLLSPATIAEQQQQQADCNRRQPKQRATPSGCPGQGCTAPQIRRSFGRPSVGTVGVAWYCQSGAFRPLLVAFVIVNVEPLAVDLSHHAGVVLPCPAPVHHDAHADGWLKGQKLSQLDPTLVAIVEMDVGLVVPDLVNGADKE